MPAKGESRAAGRHGGRRWELGGGVASSVEGQRRGEKTGGVGLRSRAKREAGEEKGEAGVAEQSYGRTRQQRGGRGRVRSGLLCEHHQRAARTGRTCVVCVRSVHPLPPPLLPQLERKRCSSRTGNGGRHRAAGKWGSAEADAARWRVVADGWGERRSAGGGERAAARRSGQRQRGRGKRRSAEEKQWWMVVVGSVERTWRGTRYASSSGPSSTSAVLAWPFWPSLSPPLPRKPYPPASVGPWRRRGARVRPHRQRHRRIHQRRSPPRGAFPEEVLGPRGLPPLP